MHSFQGFPQDMPRLYALRLQIVGNQQYNEAYSRYVPDEDKEGPFFFADTTVNIQPSARTLVDTTLLGCPCGKEIQY
jgi:phosphotransacetylase